MMMLDYKRGRGARIWEKVIKLKSEESLKAVKNFINFCKKNRITSVLRRRLWFT